PHRILKNSLAVKVVEEEHSPVIPKLTRAVPISPVTSCGVVEVEVSNALNLFCSRRNRILDHEMARLRTVDCQPHDQHVSGMNFTAQWFSLPFQFVAVFNDAEPEILPGQIQIRGASRSDVVFAGVVVQR